MSRKKNKKENLQESDKAHAQMTRPLVERAGWLAAAKLETRTPAESAGISELRRRDRTGTGRSKRTVDGTGVRHDRAAPR